MGLGLWVMGDVVWWLHWVYPLIAGSMLGGGFFSRLDHGAVRGNFSRFTHMCLRLPLGPSMLRTTPYRVNICLHQNAASTSPTPATNFILSHEVKNLREKPARRNRHHSTHRTKPRNHVEEKPSNLTRSARRFPGSKIRNEQG